MSAPPVMQWRQPMPGIPRTPYGKLP